MSSVDELLRALAQARFGAPARLGFLWTLEEILELPETRAYGIDPWDHSHLDGDA